MNDRIGQPLQKGDWVYFVSSDLHDGEQEVRIGTVVDSDINSHGDTVVIVKFPDGSYARTDLWKDIILYLKTPD